jgi:hypothetical protein
VGRVLLRSPPGNREALAGDRQGQHSIRIIDQQPLAALADDYAAQIARRDLLRIFDRIEIVNKPKAA